MIGYIDLAVVINVLNQINKYNSALKLHNRSGLEWFVLACTTPPGFTPIITQMPLKAESFSSLSRMFLSDVHLH